MQQIKKENTNIEQVQIEGEAYFRISNVDHMRPFFMSIVSDSNHWMFIGSNGGLSAGRKNANNAIFPYYTDDKIIESAEITGSKSIFQVKKEVKLHIWEPFSVRNIGQYAVKRNLYKNKYSNKILFEEINEDLQLSFQYEWNSSNQYGFVKKSKLINHGSAKVNITLLDGIQNIIPYGVDSALQNQSSNLVDAYKRNELDKTSGIGIFALSAIIVDKAEPSEALKANIAWSLGFENPQHLLSSLQLDSFRKGLAVKEEKDVKAEKGAYFIHSEISLAAKEVCDWMVITNVNQNMVGITELSEQIKNDKELAAKVQEDIELGTQGLIQLNAAADGLQFTSDKLRDTRHFSNTLFNIMRGGIFDDNYQIERKDFLKYFQQANKKLSSDYTEALQELPHTFSLFDLKELTVKSEDADFIRLCIEYLPLKFSRRHGDPSRPWNQFSINTNDEEDGSKILDYEGNWRDIFQNWEALAYSYPEFIEGMIFKFLNASTFDGYNPYRITKGGIDWEKIEPDDPWSYIGYWGDHQIIYLLKFLEFAESHAPGKLDSYFDKDLFVYANVPYRIKSYEDTLRNPKDTIEFDEEVDNEVEKRRKEIGADSALLLNKSGAIQHVNFVEKLLATVLAKMSNFIPEGGIWMNTQRPEWNDANNALVGNGVSMVTLSYLRRFLTFFHGLVESSQQQEMHISAELMTFFKAVTDTLRKNEHVLSGSINDKERKSILDGLGKAGSAYRHSIYKKSFSAEKEVLSIHDLQEFIDVSLRFLEHTIKANKREDNLYHAYNLMTVENDQEVSISYLSEMLEGQVAVLSSGYLNGEESLSVLDALKSSSLFREDQYSYILYPNKDLPGFMEKNNISHAAIFNSKLLSKLDTDGNTNIIMKDVKGIYHFNGNFKNANDVNNALDKLAKGQYKSLVESGRMQVLRAFEEIFNHKAFTGRSGTFFGYEGLGSIYWHMVSKLQLAVEEVCLKAIESAESKPTIGHLIAHYYEINAGIGVHKSPTLYGAFPTDPYSHTPATKGAQQPGMTGQVKEDILSRFGELGVFVKAGQIHFNPCMLRKEEFLTSKEAFEYLDVESQSKTLHLEAGSLGFTYCQIPVVYKLAEENKLEVISKEGESTVNKSLSLDAKTSSLAFMRSGSIQQINVYIDQKKLL
jgi:hypothetical protein